jgi:WD40 repeat protein
MTIPSARQASDTGTVDADNPWPGLAAFREADQHFFQGREAVVDALTRMILRARLTVLHGVSGLGKTSVLRAGLFPRVRREYMLPIYVRLSHAEDSATHAEQVRDAIQFSASTAGIEAPPVSGSETLWEYFHRKTARFWDARNRIVTPLLVIDQFEELFTIGRATAERRARTDLFLAELSDLVEGRPAPDVRARLERDPEEALGFSMTDQPCKVLISLREDFLPDLAALRDRIPAIAETIYRLQAMTTDEALRVVEVSGGDLVDRPVAEEIVRFVASAKVDADATGEPPVVEPALLSVFCRELNNKRRVQGGDKITADLLETKRTAIISDFYERTIAEGGLSPAVRVFVEEKLLTESGFRDSVAEEQALRTPGVTREDIDTLIARRLLRREDAGTRGRSRLEVTHDVLAEAVRVSRDRRRLHEKEQQALSERLIVEERNRLEAEEAALHAQQRREFEAAQALAAKEREAAELAHALAREEQRGREAAERLALIERRARKRQIALLSVLVLAAGTLALIAQRSATEARRAETRAGHELSVSDVDRVVDGEPWALAFLARAVRNDPESAMARAILLGQLSQQVMRVAEMRHDTAVATAALNATATRVLTTSGQGTVRLWEASAGQPVGGILGASEGTTVAAFSPDGTRVITATAAGLAQVWDAATARPIAELQHGGRVNTASFDESGRQIVTASDDQEIRVWNPDTGETIELRPSQGPVLLASFAPHGTSVLSVSRSGEAALWEPRSRTDAPRVRLTAGAEIDDSVTQASFSPDGSRLMAFMMDGTIRLFDTRTGRAAAAPLREAGPIVLAQFDATGERVITTSESQQEDGKVAVVRLWNARTGARLPAAPSHRESINAVAFSLDGSLIVTASNDHTAQVWDAATGKSIGPPLQHGGPVVSAGFSPDGARVITASQDQTARIWESRTGAPRGAPLRHDGRVVSAAFSADGLSALSASTDGTARIWDARTGMPIETRLRHAAGFRITLAALSSDGALVATAGGLDPGLADADRDIRASEEHEVRVWNTATGLTVGPPLRHTGTINSIEFAAGDAARIVTASADGTARLWNPRTGEPVGAVLQHDGAVTAAVFNADGTRVITASADGKARIWDAATGQPITAFQHPAGVTAAVFSPDGTLAVTGCDDRIARVWNVGTGAAVAASEPHDAPVISVQFSPDGDRILSSSYSTSLISDARTNKSLGRISHLGAAIPPVFSAGGSEVVVTSTTAVTSVWDVRGEPQWRGDLTQEPLRSAAFSRDGRLVTASEDGTVLFWNLRTREKIGLALHHQAPVVSVLFSDDGSRILTMAGDGVARIWDVPVGRAEDASLLADMADAVGGHAIESAGAVDHITDQAQRLAAMRESAQRRLPGDASAASFRYWLFADPATRPISPLSQITVPEYVKRLIAEGDAGRREAARMFPARREPARRDPPAGPQGDRPQVR